MSDIRELIETEARNMRALTQAIDATVERRGESRAATEAWQKACRRASQYPSLIHDWLARIDKDNLSGNPDLKDFAITYLELDPMYNGSGYIKERLLHRLKSADFDATEIERLTAVLLDAVRRRGRREFRQYCRLAAVLQQPQVLEESLRLANSPDGRVRSRAQMMLQHIQSTTPP